MNLIGRLAIFGTSAVVAAAAFVHSASEIGVPILAPEPSHTNSLDVRLMEGWVDREFKAEMRKDAEAGLTDLPVLHNKIVAVARRAFAVDPLEVSTIRSLALGSVAHTDEARARKLMQEATRISKRDSITDLWLARDYGQAGNYQAMLTSLDNALRTSQQVRNSAMRPLVGLLENPDSYAPFGQLLAQRPDWERQFWLEFVNNPAAIKHASEFFAATSLPLDRIEPDARTRLYSNMKKAGQFSQLEKLAALDPNARVAAGKLAAGQFATVGEGDPLGWTLHSTGNFAARVQQDSGQLQIDAQPGAFGLAADRIFRLAGTSAIEIVMAAPVPNNAQLELAALCAGSGGSLIASVDLKPGDKADELELGKAGCDIGNLQLSFKVESGRQAAFLQVARIRPMSVGD